MSEVIILECLIGKTFETVVRDESLDRNDTIRFNLPCGRSYALGHLQDCCESVTIEDITGDLSDLAGSPTLQAEEVFSEESKTDWGSQNYTFYKFATLKGYVTVRFLGESNGCYSESVDLYEFDEFGKMVW